MINSQNFDESMTTAYNDVFTNIHGQHYCLKGGGEDRGVCENFLSFNNTVNLEFFVVKIFHSQHKQRKLNSRI